jgi:hypothetical protein
LVKEKPEAYLDELAHEFGVSRFAVSYGLNKLKITRKKKHAIPSGLFPGNRAKDNEKIGLKFRLEK